MFAKVYDEDSDVHGLRKLGAWICNSAEGGYWSQLHSKSCSTSLNITSSRQILNMISSGLLKGFLSLWIFARVLDGVGALAGFVDPAASTAEPLQVPGRGA